MEEKRLGKIMMEEFCKAIPWGITLAVFLFLSVSLALTAFKQDMKEAVDFAQKRAINNVMAVALDQENIARIKQNAKEAIEFAAASINRKLPARELKVIVPKEE